MKIILLNRSVCTRTIPLFIACLAGCSGGDDLERYHISGIVTYQGKPVPVGNVAFEPEKKGIGGGFAPIKDGKYDTSVDGRAHLGGKHKISIVGFDGVADPNDPDSPAVPMFHPYKTEVTLSTETGTMDFEIPLETKH